MIDTQRRQDYETYLRSPEWQALRLRVLKRDGFLRPDGTLGLPDDTPAAPPASPGRVIA